MAVSPVNADRHGQTKNMERQCDRHRNTPFTEDSGDKPPVAVLAPLGFRRTTFNLPYLKHIVKFRRWGCHRRPCLFSRKRKDRGEKSAWVTGLVPQYDLGRKPICKLLHSHWVTLRALWYAPPVRMALDLPVSAFEYVQSIETAVETCGFIRIRTGLLTSRERSKKTEAVFLVGSRRSGGKSKSLRAPNRKPAQRLRFGKEEMSTEDKRRRSRRLVPPWSFLTRYFFFWRSKRKSGTAPASLQKTISLLPFSLIRQNGFPRGSRFFVTHPRNVTVKLQTPRTA